MALSPLSSSSIINLLDVQNRSSSDQASSSVNQTELDRKSGTSVGNVIDKAREDSVLYQVASKLLVNDEDIAIGDSSTGSSNDQTGMETNLDVANGDAQKLNPKVSSEDQIYNRLLTARLVGNEQFLQNLQDQNIDSLNLNYTDANEKNRTESPVVQMSDYRTGQDTKSIAEIMLTYRELSSTDNE